ncbi:MAG TPA: DedA family protein [Casimicrobiaceae bacterium]|jgi:membrane protein DedA with SNARE-associated domain|nr:DedA family protein [Casimicrobiaceae bacterium]
MVDWVTGFITSTGYLGIALLMFAENVFPPIPSELIMPFAGFVAARGELNPVGVLVAGVVGSLLGAVPWYLAGRWLGNERLKRMADRHGRWLTVSREDLERAEAWFHRYGRVSVVVGRLVPAVRTLISVPAGITRMHPIPFFAYSALGTLVWTGLLVGAGYLLESHYERVAEWIDPFSKLVLGAIVATYLYRLARQRRQ